MAIIYAPYIEGTIPAFGPKLKVPFEWNPGVGKNEVEYLVAKVLDLNNNLQGYLYTSYEGQKIAVFDIVTAEISGLISQTYYKIQLAYATSQDRDSFAALNYSSAGVGKYLGTPPQFEITYENQTITIEIQDEDNTKELPYSCLINNKEYYFKDKTSISFFWLNTEETKFTALCKTINGYEQELKITIPSITANADEQNIIRIFSEQESAGEIDISEYQYFSTDLKSWYPIYQDAHFIWDIGTPYYYGILNNGVIHYDTIYVYDDDIQLSDCNYKVLDIKFNPKVSSFKTTIQEQKTDTIGGQFPIFSRNGNLAYKEFPISGLISYHMTSVSFISWDTIGINAYYGTPATTDLVDYNVVAERKFRMAVLDWLNNGEVKLFRSPTEGIYLVRLMNVSLSPEERLGRMLYSFQATAYEVAEINYNALVKYGFAELPEGIDYVL